MRIAFFASGWSFGLAFSMLFQDGQQFAVIAFLLGGIGNLGLGWLTWDDGEKPIARKINPSA